MSIVILLTDAIRTHAYFADFNEESVTVPDKPFIREILDIASEGELNVELTSIQDLHKCIETCIYFGLNTSRFTDELFWKITSTLELFILYYNSDDRLIPNPKESFPPQRSQNSKAHQKIETRWYLREDLSEPLRSELASKWNSNVTREKLISMGAKFLRSTRREIVGSGNLKLLRWTTEQWKFQSDKKEIEDPDLSECEDITEDDIDPYTWDEESLAIAAGAGSLEILKYLHQNGYPWDARTCSRAAASGNLACLQYARENGCPWGVETHLNAAEGGHLDCLQYAHVGRLNETTSLWEGGGCPLYVHACSSAARRGHFVCLQYAFENGSSAGPFICNDAAAGGNLKCLQYAREKGYQWDKHTCTEAVRGKTAGHFECLKYAHTVSGGVCSLGVRICDDAAGGGNLDCLRYVHQNGGRLSEETCSSAAFGGNLDCLRYARENGCSWNVNTCVSAAMGGYLDCLQYAHENGCSWDKHVCLVAAERGYLAVLQYAHENGCPWDKSTCLVAVRNGHFNCLQYAFEHGCLLDKNICTIAVEGGYFDCLQYAYQNGALLDLDTCIQAVRSGSLQCLKYVHQNGYPRNRKEWSKVIASAEEDHSDFVKRSEAEKLHRSGKKCRLAEKRHFKCLSYARRQKHSEDLNTSSKKGERCQIS